MMLSTFHSIFHMDKISLCVVLFFAHLDIKFASPACLDRHCLPYCMTELWNWALGDLLTVPMCCMTEL